METKKLTMKERFGMTASYAGSVPLYILCTAYLVYFYTNVIGLNAGIVGTIMLFSRVLDGVSDLVFGNMIDRTRTKMGVCRPWVFRMSFCSLIAIIALFAVPPVGQVGIIIYAFISYNVSQTLIYTILQLSVISLPTYMTRDSKGRANLFVWGTIGQFIMQVILTSTMFKAIEIFGGGQKAWIIVSIIIGIVGLLLLLLATAWCKETVDPDAIAQATGAEEKVSLVKALKAALVNKYWWMILGFVFLGAGVYSTTATMTPYYSQFILNDTGLTDMLNSFYTWPMMLATPFYLILLKKFSKKTIALTGVCIQTIGTIIVFAAPTNIYALYAGAILKSIGFSAPTSVYTAMLSDAIEYGHWKTGVRTQAVLMGANSTGQKIGAGLISAFLGWMLASAGYDGLIQTQGTAAVGMISSLYTIVPIVLSALMIIILMVYDLDKKMPKIVEELFKKEHKEEV